MTALPTIHYLPARLLNPTDAITVNVIGAGGTGSWLVSHLVYMNRVFHRLDHPGLHIRLFDDDIVEDSNIGRQQFSDAEIGLNKAVAIISRVNRYFGFNWQAVPERYDQRWAKAAENPTAIFTISCVDEVASRKEIATILKGRRQVMYEYWPFYWIDCGNDKSSGQVLLATVGTIDQSTSKKFLPVGFLPNIVEEYGDQLVDDPTMPSCSVWESISRQDLFINHDLAQAAAKLLWQMLRNGFTRYRGVFVNNHECRQVPIPIDPPRPKAKKATSKGMQ